MSDTIASIIIGLIALVGSLVAVRVTIRSQVRLVQKDNALLYMWNRQLFDHIYKGLGPPPPAPPAGLFKE